MAVVLALLLVVAGSFAGNSQAVEYIVGDSTGWRIPPSSNFYSNWASGKNFAVGDVLVFNFATGTHDVAQVTDDAYDNCNTANPINQTNTGPARITLTNVDTDYHFICTIQGHCAGGQKLEIDVDRTTNSTTPSPTTPSPATPSPTSPPGTTTPPPPSSAASSLVAALLVSLSSIAIGFLY